MTVRAVFFDAGHTLLRAHPDLGSIYADTTARFGVTVEPARFLEAFKPVFQEFTREYADQGSASDAQDYAMWHEITRRIHARLAPLRGVDFEPWFEALYRRFGDPEVWTFYEDVEPVLRALRGRGLTLAVVSNWDTRLRRISEGLGLDRLVDFLVISAEVGVRKPDPRIFRAALDRAGVAPEETIHVGDLADEDARGAAGAGIGAVLIDRQQRITPAGHPPGIRVIASLAELLETLR